MTARKHLPFRPMPHTIYLIDAAGMAATHSTTIWSARANEVGHFYRALGLSVARQTSINGQAYLAAQCTGLALAIVPAAAPSDPNATTLYFGVDSLASALAAATSNHGQLVMQPYQTPLGYQAVVVDPDGRRTFITEIRAAAADLSGFEPPALVDVLRPRGASTSDGAAKIMESRELESLAAVKRGATASLIGIALGAIATILYLDIVMTVFAPGSGRTVDGASLAIHGKAMLLFAAIAFLTLLVGKILCGMPATSRVGYGPLWIAVGLDVAGDSLVGLNILLPSAEIGTLAQVMWLFGFASPLFFMYFLGRIMQRTGNESVATFATITNVIYGVMVVIMGLTTVTAMTQPQSLRVTSMIGGLLVIVFGVCYIVLLIRVLCAKANVRAGR